MPKIKVWFSIILVTVNTATNIVDKSRKITLKLGNRYLNILKACEHVIKMTANTQYCLVDDDDT